MSGRDDRAADVLADREDMECRECGGTGYYVGDWYYYRCEDCGGTGVWKGQA